MAKQTVNVGSSENAHNGDILRTAFIKINENFDEIYASLGGTIGSTTQLENGDFTLSLNTNGKVILSTGLEISLGNDIDINHIIKSPNKLTLTATNADWLFAEDGTLTVPSGNLAISANQSVNGLVSLNNHNITLDSMDKRWVFNTNGSLDFPDGLSIKDSNIGYSTSETFTTEFEGGATTVITTNTSQIEINDSSIVITKNVSQSVDDGVLTTVNSGGSELVTGNNGVYMKHYAEPDGPNNTTYFKVGTDNGAYLEGKQEDVGGYTLGRVKAAMGSVTITTHSIDDKNWVFTQEGHTYFPGVLQVDNGIEGSITGPNGVNIYARNATPLGLVWSLDDQENLFENDPLLNAVNTSVQLGLAGLSIEVNPASGGGYWTFSPNKTLRMPPGGDIVDSTGASVLGSSATNLKSPNGNLTTTLSNLGTLQTTALLPTTFTATVDSAHYSGEGSLTLEGDAWYFAVEFNINASGSVETIITNNTPWASNPGYANNMPFVFTEADHGIPGYTFTLTLTDIQNPGQFMYTTNLSASLPPTFPAALSATTPIKITSGNDSFVFGTDGSLNVPGSIKQGNSKLAFNENGGTNVYLTPTTDDSTAVFINDISVRAYAKESVALLAGPGLLGLEGIYLGAEQLWIEVRDQDAQIIAPATRPWEGMPSYQAYNIILNTIDPTPPIPPNLVPAANAAKNAYNLWQSTKSDTTISMAVGDKVWVLDADGNLTLPGTIQNSASTVSDLVLTAQGTGFGGNALIRTLGGDYEWTFGNDGNLTLPGNINIGDLTIQEGFPGLTVATGNNLAIGTSRYDLVSADAFIGNGADFVADIEFTDDIIAVQVGWILVGPDLPVSAVDSSVSNQYRITVPGATFVTGTQYSFRNSTPTPHAWVFGNDGVLTTPASGSISHQNNDLKLEVTQPSDVIVLRTVGGDVYVDAGGRLVVGGAIATDRSNAYIDLAGPANETLIANNNAPVILRVFDSNNVNPDKDWVFGVQGKLQLPPNGDIIDSNGVSVLSRNALQVVTPPADSYGSPGDIPGTVAFDSNYMYYCVSEYSGPGGTYTATPALLTGSSAIYIVKSGWPGPVIGMTVIHTPTGTSSHVLGFDDQGSRWLIYCGSEFDNLYLNSYSDVFTFIQPTVNNWVRVAWSTDTWSSTYTLTVNIAGGGTGTVTSTPAGISNGTYVATFAAGSQVTLNALPQIGSTFSGWSGGASGIAPATITMSSNITVTATFDTI